MSDDVSITNATEDKAATIRWRDDAEQVRVPIENIREIVRKAVMEGEDLFKFGVKVNTRVKK